MPAIDGPAEGCHVAIERKQRSWLKWVAAAVVTVLVVGGFWRWKFVEWREEALLGCINVNKLSTDDIIRNCTELIKLEPSNAAGYHGRGVAYGRTRDYQRALADLDTAVELKPNDPFGVLERAEIHRDLNQYQEAIADFTAAIDLFKTGNTLLPQSADAAIAGVYEKRAEAYRATRQHDLAIADLSETIRRGHSWNVERRALLYLEKGDIDNAIADCDLLIKNDPRESLIYLYRGVAYGRKGDYDRAVSDFDFAIKLAPRYAVAFEQRGHVFEEKGEKLRAVADYREALRIDPSLVVARAALKRLGLE
jgi:tetratricopeptide (TPR) repeat protein